MVKRASAKAVEQAIEGPDYEAALAIINGRVANAKEAQSKASGEASQAWASIEKLGVNRAGAQMFAKIANLEDEDEQQDRLRTFYKLCELEGITIHQDLVDAMQKAPAQTATATSTKPAAKTPPAAPTGDTDLADGAGKQLTKPSFDTSDAEWEKAGKQAGDAASKAKLSIVAGGKAAKPSPDAI